MDDLFFQANQIEDLKSAQYMVNCDTPQLPFTSLQQAVIQRLMAQKQVCFGDSVPFSDILKRLEKVGRGDSR